MPKLFVGGIKFEATEAQLRDHFSQYGDVVSCKLVYDKESGRPRGFGFVEFATPAEANRAIEGANGQQFMGRAINVNEAREREHTARGGFSDGEKKYHGGGRGGGRDRERFQDRGNSGQSRGGW